MERNARPVNRASPSVRILESYQDAASRRSPEASASHVDASGTPSSESSGECAAAIPRKDVSSSASTFFLSASESFVISQA